jgi:hypothetical protein
MSTMSFIRTTANKIANFVVRYASGGSKEWAQAIASELSCIENDWQALAWAFGGLRVLFSIQPSPLHSIADLDEEARKHANRRLHAVNNGWLATNVPLFVPIVSCLGPTLGIAMGRNIPADAAQLVGYLLMIPMVYRRTREPDVPDRDDQANLVRFYVNEMSALSRNSLSFWMFVAGVLVLTCGWDLEVARELTGVVILSFPWLLLLALFLAKHVNNRRRFAQIEALLGRPSND